MKRGQVTLFIVLGVVIVILLALVAFFVTDVEEQFLEVVPLSDEVEIISQDVGECLQLVVDDSLIYVGDYGGLYDNYTVRNFVESPATLDDLSEAFEFFVLDYAFYCNSYVDFGDFVTEFSDVSVSVDVNEDVVNFEIVYPVALSDGNDTYYLSETYDYSEEVSFGDYLGLADQVAESSSEGLCITCMDEIFDDKYNVSTSFQEEGELVVIEDTEEVFYFAFMV